MKTTVIYHSADFDGLFCGAIARKFLGEGPDVEYVGWDFKDKPLPLPEPEDRVYILDLPVDRPFGCKFNDGLLHHPERGTMDPYGVDWANVIWIDHHRSSIETHPSLIPGYRIDGVSACRLAWQWFLRETCGDAPATGLPSKESFVERRVSEPLSVRLAGEYDIHDRRDPRAEMFQHGLRSQELTPTVWEYLLSKNGLTANVEVERLLSQAPFVAYARDKEYADVITQLGFTVEFEGLKFLACNTHVSRSQLFEAGIKPEHDALLSFGFDGRAWRLSFYHIDGKENVDILSIAKKYGGGGHPGACGCRMKNLMDDKILPS